jgi:methionyl-tRNA formyltransferase
VNLRIALFASGSVGLQVAATLRAAGHPPCCLVFDQTTSPESVEQLVESAGVKVGHAYRSDEVRGDEGRAKLVADNIDLALLAWWPYIIKEPILSTPKVGLLNFHPSLLPYNRGKHYNFWNLVEDVPFGVTLHWVTAGVDAGDIAFQREIPKSWEDTGQTLYTKAQEAIVDLFRTNLERIVSGDIPRIPQDLSRGRLHFARELEPASELHLDRTYRGRDLLNLLRARTFPPHPGIWFTDNGEEYEVRVQITRRKR